MSQVITKTLVDGGYERPSERCVACIALMLKEAKISTQIDDDDDDTQDDDTDTESRHRHAKKTLEHWAANDVKIGGDQMIARFRVSHCPLKDMPKLRGDAAEAALPTTKDDGFAEIAAAMRESNAMLRSGPANAAAEPAGRHLDPICHSDLVAIMEKAGKPTFDDNILVKIKSVSMDGETLTSVLEAERLSGSESDDAREALKAFFEDVGVFQVINFKRVVRGWIESGVPEELMDNEEA